MAVSKNLEISQVNISDGGAYLLLSWLTFDIFTLLSSLPPVANKVANPRQNEFTDDVVIQNGLIFQNTPCKIDVVHQQLLLLQV